MMTLGIACQAIASPRRVVHWRPLLEAAAGCDTVFDEPAFVSMFVFGGELADYYKSTGGVAGFDGPCGAGHIIFDVDRVDLDAAISDAYRLADWLRFNFGDCVGVWFSGNRGFHVMLRLPADIEPDVSFHRVARAFALEIADRANVVVDTNIYDKLRMIRLPNSRHEKTGLFKVPIGIDDLPMLTADRVRAFATQPREGTLPPEPAGGAFAELWRSAEEDTAESAASSRGFDPGRASRLCIAGRETLRLPHFLRRFLSGDVDVGERATLLFRASAWLSEQGTPPHVIEALLIEPALELGLAPAEISHQIGSGVRRGSDAS